MLGTVHVSVVSVKLMPSVELDRQSQKAGQLELPVSLHYAMADFP